MSNSANQIIILVGGVHLETGISLKVSVQTVQTFSGNKKSFEPSLVSFLIRFPASEHVLMNVTAALSNSTQKLSFSKYTNHSHLQNKVNK